MDFYNFFSFSAKKAIYRASEICGQFNNQYLEPEHAFYSILNLRSCSAVQVLHQLGVNLPKLTYSLEAYLYEHAGTYKGNAIFSQRMIDILDSAYKEAKRLHHKEIGTTHLLLALSQDQSSYLVTLFAEHGLDSKKIRDTFLSHLREYLDQSQGGSGIEIKRGSQSIAQIVPPVCYDETVKQILKNAQFTAQALGYEQLTPAHLLYSSCLYAVEWWDQFGQAGVEPHLVSGRLARLMRREETQQSGSLMLSAEACDVFGRAYGLTLRSGTVSVTPAYFLQAVLESDDPQIEEVFADNPEARGALIDLLNARDVDSPFAQEIANAPQSEQNFSASYDRLQSLLGTEGNLKGSASGTTEEADPQADEPHAED